MVVLIPDFAIGMLLSAGTLVVLTLVNTLETQTTSVVEPTRTTDTNVFTVSQAAQ
ncbi:hypothetical protein HY493_04450 [Candidatus Woesearchaeota archaeon]|nr:hypothetical protein [Candidatus Woesearchaeota archaeon]